jgi:hypothetical protein
MFQRRFDPRRDAGTLIRDVVSLMNPADLVDVTDPSETARSALALFQSLRARADVEALLASGDCHYEVPFSFLAPDGSGACVRGSIDCLVAMPDGTWTVLEFKTGRPRPEHATQAHLYAQAVGAALGLEAVRAVVCYPQMG